MNGFIVLKVSWKHNVFYQNKCSSMLLRDMKIEKHFKIKVCTLKIILCVNNG